MEGTYPTINVPETGAIETRDEKDDCEEDWSLKSDSSA
jgi:hypothetical protein